MTAVIIVLVSLGVVFLGILWAGFLISVFQLARGFLTGRVERAVAAPAPREAGAIWRRGLLAGALGYAVVVVAFGGLNLQTGRNLFLTPALLGQELLGRSPTLAVDPETVLLYNGLHLVVFLALGLIGAWLLHESELHPMIWYPALVLAVVGFFHVVGFVLVLASPLDAWIPAWAVVGTSALAGAAMVGVLLAARPEALAAARRVDLEA
jgi:hypothetical protein